MFWPLCDAFVDLRRIDNSTFLRELTARTPLRDTQCKANGESRREGEAMEVVLHFFGGLVQKTNTRTCIPNRPRHRSHRLDRLRLTTTLVLCLLSPTTVQKLWPYATSALSTACCMDLILWPMLLGLLLLRGSFLRARYLCQFPQNVIIRTPLRVGTHSPERPYFLT